MRKKPYILLFSGDDAPATKKAAHTGGYKNLTYEIWYANGREVLALLA